MSGGWVKELATIMMYCSGDIVIDDYCQQSKAKNENLIHPISGGKGKSKFKSLVMVFLPCKNLEVSENLWLLRMRI
jgi:hypothetical protein